MYWVIFFLPTSPWFFKLLKYSNSETTIPKILEIIEKIDVDKSGVDAWRKKGSKGKNPEDLISFAGGWVNHKAPKELQKAYEEIAVNIEDSIRMNVSAMAVQVFIGGEYEKKSNWKEYETNILPNINPGDELEIEKIVDEQHFTQPPPRYTEASLVKKLEELGIGRPSTYAPIIQVLKTRGYVNIESRRIFPQDRGRIVTVFLSNFF